MEVRDRILIVEDDKSIRNFLKAILEANHYDVILATTGEEAYSLITSRCPDLVILDLGLPDLDGMTILQKVREWTGMPIVVVSARAMRGTRWKRWIWERMTISPSRSVPRSSWRGSGRPSGTIGRLALQKEDGPEPFMREG